METHSLGKIPRTETTHHPGAAILAHRKPTGFQWFPIFLARPLERVASSFRSDRRSRPAADLCFPSDISDTTGPRHGPRLGRRVCGFHG